MSGAALKVNPPAGRPPVLEWIAPQELQIDESYQRSLEAETSQRLIRSIAVEWDWGLCQPVNVARRGDGSLWIVDGQHRRAAAMMRGDIGHLPCVVVSFADPSQEAQAFVALNRQRRRLGATDLFKAQLSAGDKQAAAVMEMIEGAGLSLAPHQNYTRWKPGMVYCIATITAGLRDHGQPVAAAALGALREAYPGQVLQFAGQLLEGLLPFYGAHRTGLGRFDHDRFANMLGTRSQFDWVNRARTKMATGLNRRAAMQAAIGVEWERRQAPPPAMAVRSPSPARQAAEPEADGRIWCAQCDRRVSAGIAGACSSPFCKAKAR